jgi:translocation protein SEC66
MVDWVGLVLPFAYIGVLIGSLGTFSSLYRRRKAAKAAALQPWFPSHRSRDIYLSLLHLEPAEGQKGQAVPDSVLKTALLRRATENISRVMSIRASKGPLSGLVQGGHVGDDLWQTCLRAEKEMEDEIKDVVTEVCFLSDIVGLS